MTRPQLLVIVDTDAPLVGQLATSPELAAAAAIDTVRVDLVRDDRSVVDFRDFTAPDPRDWPLSFGVVSEEHKPALVRLRIRAFNSARATRGVLDGATTLEPLPTRTIDRLVEIPLPASDLRVVRVTLGSACIGAPASFQPPLRTCIDDATRDAAPTDGVLETTDGPTLAGTGALVRDVPCASPSPEGAACIPGGFTAIGDEALEGLVDNAIPSTPSRPVHLSAFHMDLTEMTVGRYRKLLSAGRVTAEPRPRGAVEISDSKFCSWLSRSDASNDALPLDCVTFAAAEQACASVGGRLPTEAEWEYVARGRGLARQFPWGSAPPDCCAASLSRGADGVTPAECRGEGLEPVRSHARPEGCGGKSDVSRDGIFDLAGSLSEVMLDQAVPFRDACWSGPGVVSDPRCSDPAFVGGTFSRGGDWSSGRFLGAAVFRRPTAMPSVTVGFRCVHDDGR